MTDPINSLLIALGRASWQGTLALVLVGILCRVFARRLPADAHCWLWRLAYGKLFLGLVLGGAVLVPLLSPAPRPLPAIQSSAVSTVFQTPATEPSAMPPNHSQPAAVEAVPQPGLSWQAYLALAYGLGLAVCLSRLLRAAGRTRRILRSSVPEPAGPDTALAAALAQRIGLRSVPPLARSAAVDSPVYVAGTILLPAAARYEEANLRMILAHELAHAKRRDLFWEWLGTLVQVAFFFHPFVVLARREERLAREAAADALALQATDAHAADYGAMLLSLSLRQNRPHPTLAGAVGVIEGGSLLRRRLLALRDAAGRTNTVRTQRLAFVLVPLMTLVFVPWKITHGQAPSPAQPAVPISQDVNPKMPAGNKQITGVVHDEQGKPVAGFTVSLSWQPPEPTKPGELLLSLVQARRVLTDSQGRFTLSGLPAGKFDYDVRLLSKSSVITEADPTEADPYAPITGALTLGETDRDKPLDLIVSTGSLVTGRVVDGQTGKPMAGIFVGAGSIPSGGELAKWSYWEMPSTGMTDAEGQYQIRVMPGNKFVGVGRISNNTLASRRISPSVRRVIAVEDQTAVAPDLPVFLYPLFVCVGPDGQPTASAKMHVVPADMPKYNYTLDDRADSTGTIVLDRIGAGMFSIAQGGHHASGTYRWSPGQPLVVTMNGKTQSYPDGVAKVTLADSPAAAATGPAVLTGTVVSETGKPIPNALIVVVYTSPKGHQELMGQWFRTNDAGLLHDTLAPIGNYAVDYVRADGFSEVFPPDKPQAVTPGITANLGTFRLVPARGVVSGRVIDRDGKPIASAVAWVEGGKTVFSAAGTDAKGYFRIPNVVPGEVLSLGLCRKGTIRDSGDVITEDKERMQISGVKAGPTEREIVWNPHT
jgi:beta-lactamase regulating signal transducer with metallopeptidase domain/protocatechuate 3,4-dioxygenase beta subunit